MISLMSYQRYGLDDCLNVLGNPVRRKIIQRLSQTQGYPLELSTSLGLQQQLISKHLKVLEEASVVKAQKESSPIGPDRRMYSVSKNVSLTIDFSPEFYITRFISYEDKLKEKNDKTFESQIKEINDKNNNSVNNQMELVSDIDEQITKLDQKRTQLLELRSSVMRNIKNSFQDKNITRKEYEKLLGVINNQ